MYACMHAYNIQLWNLLLSSQILPLLTSMLIFKIFIYFLPTEEKHDYSFTLMSETIVLGQIVVMLSLKATKYIQDSLEQTLHSVTENSCQNTQVLTKLALVLLVLYYTPVLMVLLYLIFRLFKWMKCFEWIKTKRYISSCSQTTIYYGSIHYILTNMMTILENLATKF